MEQTQALRCIVYCSTQAAPWGPEALQALVARAAARNSNQAITGQLVYLNPHFVQVLEGPPDAVEGLLAGITRDPRHHDLRVLLRQDVPGRAFPGWAMALADEAAAAAWTQALRAAAPDAAGAFLDLDALLDMPAPDGATQTRHPLQQSRARITVERIFRGARRMLVTGGPDPVTVGAVVQAAAVTEPTFYRYFNNVDDLLRVGVRRLGLRRVEEWKRVLASSAFADEVQLAEMMSNLGADNLLRTYARSPRLLKTVLPHMRDLLNDLTRPLAAPLLAAMRRCDITMADRLDEDIMHALLAAMMAAAVTLAETDIDRLRDPRPRRIAAAMMVAGMRAAARDDHG